MRLDDIFDEMFRRIIILEKKFVTKHIKNRLSRPHEYETDVVAFCVLSHASIEEYLERVALFVLIDVTDNFFNHNIISRSLILLTHQFSEKPDFVEKKAATLLTAFDYLKDRVYEAKKALSDNLYENHGIRQKHLIKIFPPLAIDLPQDAILLNSIDSLANERGVYAHGTKDRGRAKLPPSPEDMQKVVFDCVVFCNEILIKAKKCT
jgi:hypothetical protein